MVVFGGNGHNDSAAVAGAMGTAGAGSAGGRCYSSGAALYSVRCARWSWISSPAAARAAHAAAKLPTSPPDRAAAIFLGG